MIEQKGEAYDEDVRVSVNDGNGRGGTGGVRVYNTAATSNEDDYFDRENGETGEGQVFPWYSFRSIFIRHLPDWLGCLFIGLLAMIARSEYPYHSFYHNATSPYRDSSLNYPYSTHQTVSGWQLTVICTGVPLIVGVVMQVVLSQVWWNWRWMYDFHHFVLSMVECLVLTEMFTEGMKSYAGRLRPDFYDRLATGDPHVIEEGRKSYPSGHASISFAMMTFLSLYLCGKLRTFSSHRFTFPRLIVSVVPTLTWATYVMISRTHDHWHNYSDINAGAMIGICSAFATYFLNYPSLFSSESPLPKPLALERLKVLDQDQDIPLLSS